MERDRVKRNLVLATLDARKRGPKYCFAAWSARNEAGMGSL
jgi:hypothetical protein